MSSHRKSQLKHYRLLMSCSSEWLSKKIHLPAEESCPLGFVAPFILVGKQILQQMCSFKLSWDDPPSDNLRPLWESWLQDLKNLASVRIQRHCLPSSFKVQHYELHHFSDTSVSGSGECLYIRAVSWSRPYQVSSSSCSPVTYKKELQIDCQQEFFWTHSRVVLGYIINEARRFHVFVANRVEHIKLSTKAEQWRCVASEDNPADHASRDVTAEQLTASNWFTGPDLLWQRELPTGVIMVGEIKSSDPEVKKVQVHDTQAEEEKTSPIQVLRLGKIGESCCQTHVLTIIKMVQEASLSEEMQCLRCHKETKDKDKTNQLHNLCPFWDDQGVIRVGGRLTHAALYPHVRHQAVLPRDSHVLHYSSSTITRKCTIKVKE